MRLWVVGAVSELTSTKMESWEPVLEREAVFWRPSLQGDARGSLAAAGEPMLSLQVETHAPALQVLPTQSPRHPAGVYVAL